MILYTIPGSCSTAPHIALLASGLPYTLQNIDPKNKTTPSGAPYSEISPFGYVPALAHPDHGVLTEVPTILQFIADMAPDKKLLPTKSSKHGYQALKWLNFINSEVHKGFSPLFDKQLPAEAHQRFRSKLILRINWIHQTLGEGPFVLGEEWSIVDAYLYTTLQWAPRVDLNLGTFPNLISYQERVYQVPWVHKAIELENETLSQLKRGGRAKAPSHQI